jgi:hypothetical protein
VFIFLSSVKADRSINRLFQFKYKTNKQPLSGHCAAIFSGQFQVFAR